MMVKEALWLKGLTMELEIFCDNQNAIHLYKNPQQYKRTKKIDVKYHFIRGITDDGLVVLRKVHTDNNPADTVTKVVTLSKLSE